MKKYLTALVTTALVGSGVPVATANQSENTSQHSNTQQEYREPQVGTAEVAPPSGAVAPEQRKRNATPPQDPESTPESLGSGLLLPLAGVLVGTSAIGLAVWPVVSDWLLSIVLGL